MLRQDIQPLFGNLVPLQIQLLQRSIPLEGTYQFHHLQIRQSVVTEFEHFQTIVISQSQRQPGNIQRIMFRLLPQIDILELSVVPHNLRQSRHGHFPTLVPRNIQNLQTRMSNQRRQYGRHGIILQTTTTQIHRSQTRILPQPLRKRQRRRIRRVQRIHRIDRFRNTILHHRIRRRFIVHIIQRIRIPRTPTQTQLVNRIIRRQRIPQMPRRRFRKGQQQPQRLQTRINPQRRCKFRNRLILFLITRQKHVLDGIQQRRRANDQIDRSFAKFQIETFPDAAKVSGCDL
mmetsp:Transcript_10549/g.16543  ORF Transcript_10549/g.16543 Transcript_10549/m.16543 type:complete len:288 (-) Transcript_10549:14-877(-)